MQKMIKTRSGREIIFPTAEEDAAMEVEAEAGAAGGDSGALVRLLCVPSFAATGQVVLVDISSVDLPCHVLHFK